MTTLGQDPKRLGIFFFFDAQGIVDSYVETLLTDMVKNLSELVIVVNDNGRSYAPTIGGLAHHLDALRTNPGYERVLSGVKRTLLSQGAPGRAAFDALHGLKRGLKDVLVPSAFFEDLGIKYTGPVDGHDITAVEFALTRAREYAEPVIVHVITEFVTTTVPSTKNALVALRNLTDRKDLEIVDRQDDLSRLSLRNAPEAHVLWADQLNTYDVLKSDDVVFTASGLDAFLGKGEEESK